MNTFDITVLVRSEEKAKVFEQFGIHAVVGSFKDPAVVEELSEKAHVVFAIVCNTINRTIFDILTYGTHSRLMVMIPRQCNHF